MVALFLALIFALALCPAGADVHYTEEIDNSGIGPKKVGARKTTNSIYIKGERQKVRSQIAASKELAQALEKEGKPLNSSTILRLDSVKVYKVDHLRQTYAQEALPAPAAKAAPKAAANPNAPEIQFEVKALPDTSRIEGVLCRRVAAQMKARYYQAGTKTLRKENRYLYQAWIARDFPAYQEIERFQKLQTQKTSFPPLISGDLAQLQGIVEDYNQLAEKAAVVELDGLVMQSELKVFVNTGKGEEQLFQLERKVRGLSYTALPDSVFAVPKDLNQIKK
ncbi:MAG: hypothetical protein FJY95_05350 [Candidatus Handelsmanbacteria bacterium]|nr:hypothetical protein [Candidatus Handelsmanbacteria bacterium]